MARAVSSSSDGWCSVLVPWSRRANSAGSTGCEKTSIGTSTSTGPGLAVLGEQERLLDDLGEEVRSVDPPGPLHERSIDLEL